MQIIICDYCHGEGRAIVYDDHTWDRSMDICPSCKGSGRKHKFDFTMIVPFRVDIKKISAVQKQIFDIIRQFEKSQNNEKNSTVDSKQAQ